jgi:hypothetical protein
LFISKVVAIPPIKIQIKRSAKPFSQYTLSPTCESVSTCQCETARVWSIYSCFQSIYYGMSPQAGEQLSLQIVTGELPRPHQF